MFANRKQTGFIQLSRTTLWIVIIILIPLIVVLNNMGKPSEKQPPQSTMTEFDLAALHIQQQNQNQWVALPGSGIIAISVAQQQMPANRVDIPQYQDFSFTFRGGLAVTRVVIPADPAQLEASIDFLRQWLPPLQVDDRLVMSGEVDEAMVGSVRDKLVKAAGQAVAVKIPDPTDLTVIPAPAFGSPEQLAMLVAADILSKRVSGYAPALRWDYQRQTSYLTLNITLQPSSLQPPSREEFDVALQPLRQYAKVGKRSPAQIHSYLIVMAIYHLPVAFMTDQSIRLNALTLDDVRLAFKRFH